ncbi:MAG TPA: hypothetical protein VK689_17875, partial [Armatimonadota bacterium]|nr:hypothetical protein [Armatimonadota bacterium]
MTVKTQVVVLPAASIAVHVTVVLPLLNADPEGGEHVTVVPGQLSLTFGARNVTLSGRSISVSRLMFLGQVMRGASRSATVTRCAQEAIKPLLSTAVHVTTVVPSGKV